MLIDASILIDHLRGKSPAIAFLNSIRLSSQLTTNSVVVAEVLSGARNLSEQKEIDRLFSRFQIVPIDQSDCDLSISLLRQYRLSHGIGWHDCLIAASAIRLNIAVATLNDRHFRAISGLGVNRPY